MKSKKDKPKLRLVDDSVTASAGLPGSSGQGDLPTQSERRRLPRFDVSFPAWIRLASDNEPVPALSDMPIMAEPQAHIINISASGMCFSVSFAVLGDLMETKNRADWRQSLPVLVRFKLPSRQLVSVVCGVVYVRRATTDIAEVGVVLQRFILGDLALQDYLLTCSHTDKEPFPG